MRWRRKCKKIDNFLLQYFTHYWRSLLNADESHFFFFVCEYNRNESENYIVYWVIGIKILEKKWKECVIVVLIFDDRIFQINQIQWIRLSKEVLLQALIRTLCYMRNKKREEISYVKWDVKKFLFANGKCQWIVICNRIFVKYDIYINLMFHCKHQLHLTLVIILIVQ